VLYISDLVLVALVSLNVSVLQTHRRDRVCLQRHLADSHNTCHQLRTRMEELINFLEDLLSMTPPQDHGVTRRQQIASCLNETKELLIEVASKHCEYGMF